MTRHSVNLVSIFRGEAQFGVACCRRIWPLIKSVTSRRAVAVAEGYADGTADRKSMVKAGAAANAPARAATDGRIRRALWAARQVAVRDAWPAGAGAAECARLAAGPEEGAAQCRLLRCLFGYLLWPVRPQPAWVTPDVQALTQAVLDQGSPEGLFDADRLAILADALEDAGCAKPVVDHLRAVGPHARGCWAIDLLLGKG